jgi:hypothetical protein
LNKQLSHGLFLIMTTIYLTTGKSRVSLSLIFHGCFCCCCCCCDVGFLQWGHHKRHRMWDARMSSLPLLDCVWSSRALVVPPVFLIIFVTSVVVAFDT